MRLNSLLCIPVIVSSSQWVSRSGLDTFHRSVRKPTVAQPLSQCHFVSQSILDVQNHMTRQQGKRSHRSHSNSKCRQWIHWWRWTMATSPFKSAPHRDLQVTFSYLLCDSSSVYSSTRLIMRKHAPKMFKTEHNITTLLLSQKSSPDMCVCWVNTNVTVWYKLSLNTHI